MGARGLWRVVMTVSLFSILFASQVMAAQFTDLAPALGLPGAIGAAWGDYNADGYPDLFVAGNQFLGYGARLLRNNGDLTFTEVSDAEGIQTAFGAEIGPAWSDYDNDGKLDVFVGSDGLFSKLYQNDGTKFTDMAAAAGLTAIIGTGNALRNAAWCDYDGDNWLDLFACFTLNGGIARLLHNNHDGTFSDVTVAAGMAGAATPEAANCCAWGDYNNDGWPDLIVTRQQKRPLLYRNNGDGTLTEMGSTFLSAISDSTGVAWADYNNDGWLDLYVTGPSESRGWLFHSNGDGTFTDVTDGAGLSSSHQSDSPAWADYDNDGYVDLYLGNVQTGGESPLYHNNGDGTFTNVADSAGITGTYHDEAAAWADADLDGRMDLFQAGQLISRFFHNNGPTGNWLRVRALTSRSGDATGSDPVRDAIGAVVTLNLDNDEAFPTGAARTLLRVVDGGSGFLGQNEPIAQFGLGDATLVAVRVRFPDGSVVIHRSVAANQQVTIKDVPAGYVEIFTDVPLDYWSYPQVKAVEDASIVKGYADGTYKPTDPVTRDQMAVYISRALAGGDASVPSFTGTPSFSDVDASNWALKYVQYAVSKAVVKGYSDGTYKPTDQVDRGQMSVFIARAIATPTAGADLVNYTPPGTATFADVPTSFWAYKYVEYIAQPTIAVTKGYPDGDYHPEYVCTRDQMAVYVARAFKLQ